MSAVIVVNVSDNPITLSWATLMSTNSALIIPLVWVILLTVLPAALLTTSAVNVAILASTSERFCNLSSVVGLFATDVNT
jgi:hypothetical protein